MKVYAEFIEDNGLLYRTKTLLQYGDSWELIGSIVMKNPGSAIFNEKISNEVGVDISNFYQEKIKKENWFYSKGDPTINKIAHIFDGRYVEKKIQLNGIIQVFNILNVCDSKTNKAIEKANKTNSEFLLPNKEKTIILFKQKPVYLGFFDFYTDKTSNHLSFMDNYARSLFSYVKNSEFMYLPFDDIIDNPMYHPSSPHINKNRNQPILKKFISFYEKN